MATMFRYQLPVEQTGWTLSGETQTSFTWEYEDERSKLLALYDKGKKQQWDAATRIDWSQDLDPENPQEIDDRLIPIFGSAIWEKMTDKEKVHLRHHQQAQTLSQFMHGEQGALLATAQIVNTVPWTEAKFYAAAQVADEARHVEVYRRYLTEKLELSYPVNPHLHTLLSEIIREPRWDMTYLGMQIMVEGLALAAFGMMNFTNPQEKLIQDITAYVMRDEARHVAFGVLSLEEIYPQMSAKELREREDFVIESAYLMRDRLLMHEVWERLGWDVDLWVSWSLETPFMLAFRQLLFSKIVPNLKRLNLLTPRVREAFAKLGVLQFEDLPDSTRDERVTLPPALLEFFQQHGAAAQQ